MSTPPTAQWNFPLVSAIRARIAALRSRLLGSLGGGLPPPPPGQTTIDFKVVDSTGKPIGGAHVTGSFVGTTDVTGTLRVVPTNQAAATYTYSVSAPGFVTSSGSFTVVAAQLNTVPVTLAASPGGGGTPQLTSITVTPTPTTGNAPLTVTFSGKALDQNGMGIAVPNLYLFINGVQAGGAFPAGANGSFSTTHIFTAAGTYQYDVSSTLSNT